MEMFTVSKKETVRDLLSKEFSEYSMKIESVPIDQSIGRILAEDIRAQENIPSFVRSTVDGYAVKSANTIGASESLPALVSVVGESIMGQMCSLEIKDFQAVYVPTGGSLPLGADGVVMIEYTDKFGSEIGINKSVSNLENTVGIGDDVALDEVVFKKGTKIGAHHIGALAALGYDQVPVRHKPKISIISTGDELIPIGAVPSIGQIRDSNSHSIKASVEACGCEVLHMMCLQDDFDLIKDSMKKAVDSSDIVFISGGSSVGTHDMTSDIINELGRPGVLVHGVAIKPGKPTIVAKVNETAVFGLPGHPASCLVSLKAIVEPFVREVLLQTDHKSIEVVAESGFQMHMSSGRDVYYMVTLERRENGWTAHPVHGKSGMVSMFSKADGYVEIPMEKEGLEIGESISVKLFE